MLFSGDPVGLSTTLETQAARLAVAQAAKVKNKEHKGLCCARLGLVIVAKAGGLTVKRRCLVA